MSGNVAISLAKITADDANQPRTDELDDAHIKLLMDVPDFWPPVKVVWLEGPGYLLVDGFHRYEAALRLQLTEIQAAILPIPEGGDLVALAFELNAVHGRPLTREDRNRHVEHLLRNAPHQSDRLIAQKCGVSPTTAGAIRKRLEVGAQIERSAERMGADGRVYLQPERRPGALPDKSLGQFVSDGLKGMFDTSERRQMRDTARYLQRLSVALADSQQLSGWTDPQSIATACVETFGEDRAHQLACDLSTHLDDIIDVIDTIAPPQ